MVNAGVACVGVVPALSGCLLERYGGDGGTAVGRQEVVGHAVVVEVIARAHVERERVDGVRGSVAVVIVVGVVTGSVSVGIGPLVLVVREGVEMVDDTVVVVVAVQF